MQCSTRDRLLYAAAILYTISIYGTMAMMSIAAGVVFAAWLLLSRDQWRVDLKTMYESQVFWPTVFLTAGCLWSLAWAKFSGLTFLGMRPTVTLDDTRKAWHLFFPFILFAVCSRLNNARLRRVVKTWWWMGLVAAVLGIVQHYLPIYNPMQLPHTMREEWRPPPGLVGFFAGKYHATGLAGFHLSYAAIIGFPATMSLALVAVLYRRRGISRRTLAAAAAFFVFFVANVLTYSKIAWVALPLAVVLIALVGFKGRPRYALIGLVVAVCIGWGASSSVRERFFDNRGRSIVERKMVWAANFEMIRQFPIFGVGWHRNSELSQPYYRKVGEYVGFESHAHNNLIDQWATTGLFGLVGFLWLNAVLIMMALRLYRENYDLVWRTMGLGLIGGWLCLHVNGLTQANWWDAKVLHQIGWVTAMTMVACQRLKSPTRS